METAILRNIFQASTKLLFVFAFYTNTGSQFYSGDQTFLLFFFLTSVNHKPGAVTARPDHWDQHVGRRTGTWVASGAAAVVGLNPALCPLLS